MAASIFSVPPNAAHVALGVRAPDRRWHAFDVSMDEARVGKATQLVTALWNYHCKEGDKKVFREWGITRDPATGIYWYRVARRKGGDQTNGNLLFEALRIASNSGIRIRGILKDQLTRWCAPNFVFPIGEVLQNQDGTNLWLRVDAPDGRIGTEVASFGPPPLFELSGAPQRRRLPVTRAQFEAACDLAELISQKQIDRQSALRSLKGEHDLTEGTASALLNNYRCLLTGTPIKAPMGADAMRHFVDSILSIRGDAALPHLIASVRGFVEYTDAQSGSPAQEMRNILETLQGDAEAAERVKRMLAAATGNTATGSLPPGADSELLKQVWVRGPQHAAFRRQLQRRWFDACSVHGVECDGQLRASHIVAWRLDEALRGDVNNGLLLSVPLDSLFDRGLITFGDAGELLASHRLSKDTALLFGIRPGLRIRWEALPCTAVGAIRQNLARHRQHHWNEARHTYAPVVAPRRAHN